MKIRAVASIGIAVAWIGGRCVAAEPSARESAPKFGTANNAVYDISPFDFVPIDSTTHYERSRFDNRYTLSTASPYGTFFASPELPAGALLVGMSVYACNGNPPGGDDFLVQLENTDTWGTFLGVLGSITVLPSGTCSTLSVDLSGQNYTVNNAANRLLVWTIFGPNPPVDAIVAVGDVTLTYKLQVGRPPLAPTFSDVPVTDPGFRYVEAVAAAGITAGCGGGLFCPDQSVTRRQVAVFLSRALGLAFRFGTVVTSLPVPEWQFRPADDSVQYADTGPPQFSRYLVSTTSDTSFAAPVALPPGARLDEVEFDFCDDRPPDSAPMLFSVHDAPLDVPLVQLQSTPGGGCGSVIAHDVGFTVGDSKLVALVVFQGPYGNAQSRFQGARFAYQVQVSPPPASATFADVPTSDPAFADVEALAASGITGGCGGGNFCPTSPVTRRQMAIFLAKALGLSFD